MMEYLPSETRPLQALEDGKVVDVGREPEYFAYREVPLMFQGMSMAANGCGVRMTPVVEGSTGSAGGGRRALYSGTLPQSMSYWPCPPIRAQAFRPPTAQTCPLSSTQNEGSARMLEHHRAPINSGGVNRNSNFRSLNGEGERATRDGIVDAPLPWRAPLLLGGFDVQRLG
jgi:hypothetical protein